MKKRNRVVLTRNRGRGNVLCWRKELNGGKDCEHKYQGRMGGKRLLFRAASRSKNLACRELAFCLLWMHEAARSLNSSCSDARKSPPCMARCVEKSIP